MLATTLRHWHFGGSVQTHSQILKKTSNQVSKYLSSFSKERDGNRTLSTVLTLNLLTELIWFMSDQGEHSGACFLGKAKTLNRIFNYRCLAARLNYIFFLCSTPSSHSEEFQVHNRWQQEPRIPEFNLLHTQFWRFKSTEEPQKKVRCAWQSCQCQMQ